MPKKVIISVTNDLVTDQRVQRTVFTLSKQGYDITLIGRKKRDSFPLQKKKYKTVRMRIMFEKGPLFYIEYTKRLFLYLLFHKADILIANDLDTLLPNFLISKLKGSELYYDSHEYFTGVPELKNRKIVKNIWKTIERFLIPKLKHMYTVNDSIALLYEKEYGIKVNTVRNIPLLQNDNTSQKSKEELNLPTDKKIILYQGAGINVERGIEEAIEAMQYLEGAILLIIGGGDIIDNIKSLTQRLNLNDKVIFIDKITPEELRQYTVHADIGLTLDKDTNINYKYSLPNKLFDYIYAEVPVLASPVPEVKKIINYYNIGVLISNHQPKHIATKIKDMLKEESQRRIWKSNLKKAKSELNWEKEERKLLHIYGIT